MILFQAQEEQKEENNRQRIKDLMEKRKLNQKFNDNKEKPE